MRIAFIHLSDIHFGQEKGTDLYINNDVKEAVIEDCRNQIHDLMLDRVEGLLITGDLAYSGKPTEYEDAHAWLDRLTAAVNCVRTAVRIVPGNHDIDRDEISESISDMLDAIEQKGEDKLLAYLKSEHDRNALLRRFEGYRLFAESYDCSLDTDGGWAGDHVVELDNGRRLRIVGVNSALTCRKKGDEKGKLLLGGKQRPLHVNRRGEELVVLTHHPLDWFQDSEDARRFLRNRARVYLSGHEHNPKVHVERVDADSDLLMIAAGATVPPKEDAPLKYCYNILVFETTEGSVDLNVTVVPRRWDHATTAFVEDADQLKEHGKSFPIKCPNFRAMPKPEQAKAEGVVGSPNEQLAASRSQPPVIDHNFALILLRFFRELDDARRVEILVRLEALPRDWNGPLSHAIERRCLDRLREQGKLRELKELLDLHARKGGEQ